MKISDLLYEAQSGQLQIPRFQRGWVWTRKQVLKFFESLYKNYPIGTVIIWPSEKDGHSIRSVIDGQQRLTTLYGLINGQTPPWFKGETSNSLKDLMFNVETEEFKYRTKEISDNPLWVDVTKLFQKGLRGWAEEYRTISKKDADVSYYENVSELLRIRDRELHIERLPDNIDPEEAAKVFRIVNREGTKVTEGDLVLGQLSLKWDNAQEHVGEVLQRWRDDGYTVSLEWLLHAMSASLGGRINFEEVLKEDRTKIVGAFKKVTEKTSETLDNLRNTLGLDATTTTAINNGLIIVVINKIVAKEKTKSRKLIGWWLLSTLHDRWKGDIRNRTNRDIQTITSERGVEGLIEELQNMIPYLDVRSNGFQLTRSSKPYYRLLLTLTRRYGAKDLGSGLTLSFSQTSERSKLEAHHIFPRRLLSDVGKDRKEIDQLANLAFITQDTNLRIGARSPAEYLPELEESNPGVLKSQWIPMEPRLWTIDKYPEFLKERSEILAEAANKFLHNLIGEY